MNTSYVAKYYLCFIGPFVLFFGWRSGSFFGRLGPFLLYQVITPILDVFVGAAKVGDTLGRGREGKDNEERVRSVQFAYRLPLLLWVLIHCGIVKWTAHMGMALQWWEILWLGVSSGMVMSVSVAVAHELLHKLTKVERSLASLLLITVFFGHYRVAHHQHHKHVATVEDFSTARLGETAFEFVPRSFIGGFVAAFDAECERLRGKNLSWFNLDNEVLVNWAFSILLAACTYIAFGEKGLAVLVVQGMTAVYVHEMTSYIEHYGLRRRKLQNGKLEPVGHNHSWVAAQRFTNYLTFNVQIHPDHHIHSLKPYEDLVVTQSPTLPAGYPAMMTLAYCPPLWRLIIDHRIPIQEYNEDAVDAKAI